MNTSISLENQLLVTKLYVPVRSGTLISRPRLTNLLNESLKYPLTLVSAAAGFGKTTLLASWSQSLPSNNPRVVWVSLDGEDNEPRLFWAYVLTALNKHMPERFGPLLTLLQSPQSPPLTLLLAELINLLVEGTDHFLLILDDYHLITEQQVHTALTYLIEHLPPQLRIMVATRADPPLPLARLRSREQALEVRTDQLRCTLEETKAFLQEVMGLSLPDETIQEITTRTEGWLVGLQLLGLSLPENVSPVNLLKEVSGNQSYILDYLTEAVLSRQPQEVQTFLLCTSILEERLTASLCDAVVGQSGSQLMLQRLEQANLFVVSLDSKREWYRYHALFAEALCYQLKQTHADLIPLLHHRASLWYAKHDQMIEAILHALHAQEWQWAADLIERKSLQLMSQAWGASQRMLAILQEWIGQLPAEVMYARPLLCYASSLLLLQITPFSTHYSWLDAAETTLTTSLTAQEMTLQMQQEQENLLGAILTHRAVFHLQEGNGWRALALCERALTLVSADNLLVRSQILLTRSGAFCAADANDAKVGIQIGLQGISLARDSGLFPLALNTMCVVAISMIQAGQLHETQKLMKQAMLLGKQPEGLMLSEVGLPSSCQAELLREWNELDASLTLAEEAISLSKQVKSAPSLIYLLWGYGVLLRIYLSYRELEAARSALQQVQRIGTSLSQHFYISACSHFTIVDQVRLWLACGELDRATCWAQELDMGQRHSNPYVCEREEVACARILLAKHQPDLALRRLEPVLQRASAGQRWRHAIEICLLQALAHQMLQEEALALNVLSEAVHLAESEGYIRSFVDEGTPMEALLYQLRKRERKHGPTPYLDTLLAAFQQESKAKVSTGGPTKAHQLPEPLSERELQVLRLLARGASNLEIAQELVIAIDTVKRHVSSIFSKLGVHNRIQAVKQAKELEIPIDEF